MRYDNQTHGNKKQTKKNYPFSIWDDPKDKIKQFSRIRLWNND